MGAVIKFVILLFVLGVISFIMLNSIIFSSVVKMLNKIPVVDIDLENFKSSEDVNENAVILSLENLKNNIAVAIPTFCLLITGVILLVLT